jgi:OmpA-OmpF porin, OOP family
MKPIHLHVRQARFARSSVLLLALGLFAVTAHAQYHGGVKLGQSKGVLSADPAPTFVDWGFYMPQVSAVESKSGYGLKLGTRISEHLAVEGTYSESARWNASASSQAAALGNRVKTSGFGLDLVGSVPLYQRLSLFGRAGVQRVRAEGMFAGTGNLETFGTGISQSVSAGRFGLGLQYDVTRNLGLRLEVDRFRKLGGQANSVFGSAFDTESYSVGVQYRF